MSVLITVLGNFNSGDMDTLKAALLKGGIEVKFTSDSDAPSNPSWDPSWEAEPMPPYDTSDAAPVYSVADLSLYGMTVTALSDLDKPSDGYVGGPIRRAHVARFLGAPSPYNLYDALISAQPVNIPEPVWRAWADRIVAEIRHAKANDFALDAGLGAAAESIAECSPLAAAVLVLARVQNRRSLDLATGGHHPLSNIKDDRSLSNRAENLAFITIARPLWRA